MSEKNENGIDHYLDALKALKYIMSQSKNYFGHWIDRIQGDIEEWQTKQISAGHLGNYGGMGSFNDLGGGPYFSNFQSIAYRLAGNPKNIEDIEESLGTIGLQLDGWHCDNCGNSEVYKRKIEYYVINHFVRDEVVEYFYKGALLELAKKRANFDKSILDDKVKRITEIVKESNIMINESDEWQEACSQCGTKLEIYHWIMNQSGDKFIPHSLDGKALPDNIRSAFK